MPLVEKRTSVSCFEFWAVMRNQAVDFSLYGIVKGEEDASLRELEILATSGFFRQC